LLRLTDQLATVSDVLTVDDVEPFVSWLRAHPAGQVDLGDCGHVHTGALQALLLFRPALAVPPGDGFLKAHILPLLNYPPEQPIDAGGVNP
jgi:hypothetical protein